MVLVCTLERGDGEKQQGPSELFYMAGAWHAAVKIG